MPKLNGASIRLVLFKSKQLSDGTYPIMISVAYNKSQKYKSTGFSCTEKYFDAKQQLIKKGYPNHNAINEAITKQKNIIVERKLELERNRVEYTSSSLLEELNKPTVSKFKFKHIIIEMAKDKKLSYKTMASYKSAYNSLKEYMNCDFDITDLTDDDIINWIIGLQSCNNSKLLYIAKIYSVINYANEQKIIDKKFEDAHVYLSKKIKKETKHKSLENLTLIQLKDYFDKMSKFDLFKRNGKSFALALYLNSYLLNGLAPVDLLLLRTENITETTIKGRECFIINTKRSKTNEPVRIVIGKSIETQMLFEPFYQTIEERNGWLFPTFFDVWGKQLIYKTKKQVSICIDGINKDVNKHLKEIADEIGIEKFTLYSARHSFASMALKNNVPIGNIAAAMGRSVEGISRYLDSLTNDEELLDITDNL